MQCRYVSRGGQRNDQENRLIGIPIKSRLFVVSFFIHRHQTLQQLGHSIFLRWIGFSPSLSIGPWIYAIRGLCSRGDRGTLNTRSHWATLIFSFIAAAKSTSLWLKIPLLVAYLVASYICFCCSSKGAMLFSFFSVSKVRFLIFLQILSILVPKSILKSTYFTI